MLSQTASCWCRMQTAWLSFLVERLEVASTLYLIEPLLGNDVFVGMKDRSKIAQHARLAPFRITTIAIISIRRILSIVFAEACLTGAGDAVVSSCASSSMLSCVSLRVEVRSRYEVPGITEPYDAGLKSDAGCTRPGGAADMVRRSMNR